MASLAVILLSAYAFSQLSFSNLLPGIVNQGLLVISIMLLLLDDFIHKYRVRKDIFFPLSILMIGITLFWNNQDVAKYGWLVQIYNVILYIFYWISREQNRWHKSYFKMMMGCGIFYTVGTFVCTLVPAFYNNLIYPLMRPLGYIQDYKAGFTAFYGTNGLYMCIGLCAILSYLFLNPVHKRKSIDYVISLALIVGMLLSGKRGQFIAIIFAFFVAYYFYNSNKKHGRIMKIIGISILAVIALYFISFFLPGVLTIIERFQEQIDKGDVSTVRFVMWGTAWLLFTQNPFAGYGWRWFRYSSYTLVDYDVHNVFLQLLVEVGIFAALPFYIFIFGNVVCAIRLLIKVRNQDNTYSNTVYIVTAIVYEVFFVALCVTGTALYQFEYMFPFFACCGLINFYSREIGRREWE